MERRRFPKRTAVGAAGISIGTKSGWFEPGQDEEPLKVKEFCSLGRTGFRVSDIGGGNTQDPGLISAMLDAGMNDIDTAESYPGSHKRINQAIKGRDRKSIFITTKTEVKDDVSKEGFLAQARKCMDELGTEYLDCMMMHCPDHVETLKTEI